MVLKGAMSIYHKGLKMHAHVHFACTAVRWPLKHRRCIDRFLRDLPADDAAATALVLLASAHDMQHRQALVSLLSTLTPALSGQLLEQLRATQLGLNTLSHIPQPWADRLAHLVSERGAFFCAGRL